MAFDKLITYRAGHMTNQLLIQEFDGPDSESSNLIGWPPANSWMKF